MTALSLLNTLSPFFTMSLSKRDLKRMLSYADARKQFAHVNVMLGSRAITRCHVQSCCLWAMTRSAFGEEEAASIGQCSLAYVHTDIDIDMRLVFERKPNGP